jgi:hypothetical protein
LPAKRSNCGSGIAGKSLATKPLLRFAADNAGSALDLDTELEAASLEHLLAKQEDKH